MTSTPQSTECCSSWDSAPPPRLWIGPALGLNYMNMYKSEGRLIGELDPAVVGTDRLYLGPGIQLYSDTREPLALSPVGNICLYGGAQLVRNIPGAATILPARRGLPVVWNGYPHSRFRPCAATDRDGNIWRGAVLPGGKAGRQEDSQGV